MFGWLRGLRGLRGLRAAKDRMVWAEIGAGRDRKWAKQVLTARRDDFPRGTRCRIKQRRQHFPIECHIPESMARRMLRTGQIIDYR